MEVKSEPATTSETVTDLEFSFLSGDNRRIQLRGPEHYSIAENVMTITKLIPISEIVTIHMTHVTWWSVMDRVVVYPVKKPIPPTAANTQSRQG